MAETNEDRIQEVEDRAGRTNDRVDDLIEVLKKLTVHLTDTLSQDPATFKTAIRELRDELDRI